MHARVCYQRHISLNVVIVLEHLNIISCRIWKKYGQILQ